MKVGELKRSGGRGVLRDTRQMIYYAQVGGLPENGVTLIPVSCISKGTLS